MEIANPIYDVVFKYLMEDSKISALLISKVIEQEILEINVLPKERPVHIDRDVKSFTVLRLDFIAKIKTNDGEKVVLIEIQKGKYASDIMRFRRYLGQQYQNKENVTVSEINGRKFKQPIPIITIYFLGYGLEHTQAPVIKVKRSYYDATTGNKITQREQFIETLTHDSFVIQIPYLKKKRQTDIEKILSVFDQRYKAQNQHILNVIEEDFPTESRLMIRRLQQAISEPDVRDAMDVEDEILEELQDLERSIENKDKTIQQNAKALKLNTKALEQKDKTIEQNAKTLEQNAKALDEKDRLIDELKKKLEQGL